MSNMQKEYLKNWAFRIALALFGGVMITFLVLGEPWEWITLGVIGAVCLIGASFVILEVIGSTIWHWRLMGECKTEWEEDALRYWWRFMNYHTGNWEEYIPRMVEEEYEEDEYTRQKALDLFNRFKAVKPPKWYWKESEG